jgi:hypothetical protein
MRIEGDQGQVYLFTSAARHVDVRGARAIQKMEHHVKYFTGTKVYEDLHAD